MTDAEEDDPRASVVIHMDPELLPRNWEKRVRADVEEQGDEFRGAAEWMVYLMEFVDEDRVGLFMDNDQLAVLRDLHGALSLSEADGVARAWIEETGRNISRVPFGFLPHIFQYALMAAVKDAYVEIGPEYFMWCPGEIEPHSEWVAVRQFPPDVKSPSEEGKWNLMRREGIEMMLSERRW